MAFISGRGIVVAPAVAGVGSGAGSGCASILVSSTAVVGIADEERSGSAGIFAETLELVEFASAAITAEGCSTVFAATTVEALFAPTVSDGVALVAVRARATELVFPGERTELTSDSGAGLFCGAIWIGTELATELATGSALFAASTATLAERSLTAVPGNLFRTTAPAFARFDAATMGESVGGTPSTTLLVLPADAGRF
jgi:hypothetical protein